MADYIYFDDEELYKDLAERLAKAEAQRDILKRCCEALLYICDRKDRELAELQETYSKSLQQQLDMARTQETMAGIIASLKR